ncbi:MAG: S-layer homology domain-containing protein [Candidatus Peregrinibacteria bacterium]
MEKLRNTARPLLVVAFVFAAVCFAVINISEQARASVSGFLAFSTGTPSKGICWAGGAPDVPQTYTQADVGQGYAKVRKGTGFTTGAALKAACTADDYNALRSLYCARNPGAHFFKSIAMYGQDDKYIPYSMDCGPDCNWYDCSEVPQGASSSVASSSAPSPSVPKGTCYVSDLNGYIPTPADPASGQGYVVLNKGNYQSMMDLRAACTQADFDTLGRTFCDRNPGVTYRRAIGQFTQSNQYIANACWSDGCKKITCQEAASSAPSHSSSPAVSSRSTETAKGACVVRDFNTAVPSAYAVSDVGDGYVKRGKGTMTSLSAVRDACTQDDYDALADKYCAENPDNSYEMDVALYDQNGNLKSKGCGDQGCDLVQCSLPEEEDWYDEGTDGDETNTEDGYSEVEGASTGPAAGYEDEVITNSVGASDLPAASYEDEILADIESYRNPFPDTDLAELTGKAAAELYRRAVIGGFPDGEFKADRPVNRAEAAKFLLLTRDGTVEDAGNDGRFPDVRDGEWYTKYVVAAANEGVIRGYPDGLFRPANQVNTAEFLKMLTLTLGLEEGLDYGYKDVPADSWFAPFAGIAQKYDLFPGRVSRLSPTLPLSRGDVAVAIYQYLAHR